MNMAPEQSVGDGKRTQLLARLEEIQRELGWVSRDSMVQTAAELGLTLGDVYGVATFYSFLSVHPLGRNIIRICKSLPCHAKNTQMIVEAIREQLGISPGETTPDGRFSFALTNCIGACDEAPAMLINDHVHGELTPAKIVEILRSYK